MKPYYEQDGQSIHCNDALRELPELQGDSVDLLTTDPPYGISFMGKSWDKALPDIQIWRECLRVLKPGAFAFVMSIPRSDCLSRMIISLEDAGFRVDFTPIFWTYASGFPKAQNIGKAVDKRLGAEREVVGTKVGLPGYCDKPSDNNGGSVLSGRADGTLNQAEKECAITAPATPQAKALEGSYGGYQPKPAVEVIIVAMKPLSEKTFVSQALINGKGITWLDDCRIPTGDNLNGGMYSGEGKARIVADHQWGFQKRDGQYVQPSGRFPANLLVSDDVLDDGRERISQRHNKGLRPRSPAIPGDTDYIYGDDPIRGYSDSGSFSRYFDLDQWWAKTFPFLIVPKASKSEKNRHLERAEINANKNTRVKNNHPTVKPLKLMSYLITMGSREGDTVLDPFLGSGTTAVASQLLSRKCIGIEIEERYAEIAAKRLSQSVMDLGV